MLTALDNNKKIFASETDERKNYYCPYCKNIVRLWKPSSKIDHFKHKTKKDCAPEPETKEHHQGKKYLYDLLNKSYDTVILEPTCFLQYGFKPDIYVEDKNYNIMIEYQCSPITRNEIIRRTKAYTKHGMYTLWILGIKKFDVVFNGVRKVKDMEKQLHQMFFGWVYYLGNDMLFRQKFKSFSKMKYANDYAARHFGACDHEYFYKTKREIVDVEYFDSMHLIVNFNNWKNNSFNIATLCER